MSTPGRWIRPILGGAVAAIPGLVTGNPYLLVGLAGLATLAGEILPPVIFMPAKLLTASGEQRQVLRDALIPKLEPPSFQCISQLERVGVTLTVGDESYTDNFLLWVRVENQESAGDFSARLSGFSGLPGIADMNFEVPEVAWETTIEKSVHLTRGGVARLRIGAFSLSPRALWFYAARSATWANDSHQATERFSGYYGSCTFNLAVHNETADTTRIYQAEILVATDGTIGWRIDEDGTNFGMHTMSPERPVLGGDTGPAGVG